MSAVLWCDKGEHAFSVKDEDRQHFTQTRTVKSKTGNSYGHDVYQDRVEVTEELDICGNCWKTGNPFGHTEQELPALTATDETTVADAEAAAYEAEVEMWKAKYEAARERNGY